MNRDDVVAAVEAEAGLLMSGEAPLVPGTPAAWWLEPGATRAQQEAALRLLAWWGHALQRIEQAGVGGVAAHGIAVEALGPFAAEVFTSRPNVVVSERMAFDPFAPDPTPVVVEPEDFPAPVALPPVDAPAFDPFAPSTEPIEVPESVAASITEAHAAQEVLRLRQALEMICAPRSWALERDALRGLARETLEGHRESGGYDVW